MNVKYTPSHECRESHVIEPGEKWYRGLYDKYEKVIDGTWNRRTGESMNVNASTNEYASVISRG